MLKRHYRPKRNPAAVAAATGVKKKKNRFEQGADYQAHIARAILSYTVGPDLLVQTVSFKEVVA